MNKTQYFAILAVLLVLVIAFTGCEVTVDIKPDTTQAGDTVVITDENGENIPVVTVVEVTNEQGDVVATESVTLSKEEINDAKDFFSSGNKGETTPSQEAADRVTKPAKDEEPIVVKPNKKPSNNNTQSTTGAVAQAPEYEFKGDLATIRSSKYMIAGRVVGADGTSSVYKIARDGSKYAAFITGADNKEIGLIMGDPNVYMITNEDNSYIEIPKSLLQENATEEDMQAILSGDAYNVTKEVLDSHKKTINGVKYTLIRYDDGTVDYVNGTTLVKTVAEDGSVLYYDTITTDFSAGVFLPPAGYTQKDFTYENVSQVVGDIATTESTDESHDHDE